jgi:hypothetical protein
MRLLQRRWYVVLLGMLLTAVAIVIVYQRQGVYWARTNVVFLAPQSHQNPNRLASTSNTLIATSGIIEQKINRGHPPILPVSPDVPLVAQGVRDGWQVFVPNYGGQWAVNYERATLIVDVAGPTPAEVTATTKRLVHQITDELLQLQDAQKVKSCNLITAQPSPAVPVIQYATGRPKVAALATLGLGAGLTCVAAWAVDGLLLRRRRRKSASPPAAPNIDVVV